MCHSQGIELHDDDCCALIRPNCQNQIAFGNQYLLLENRIVHKVQVDFKPRDSSAVVGLASTYPVDCSSFKFEFNETLFILWFLGERRLVIKGKTIAVRMPYCNGGAIVKISLGKGQDAAFAVHNPGEKEEVMNVPIQNLPDALIHFVGGVQTGRRFMSFRLIEN